MADSILIKAPPPVMCGLFLPRAESPKQTGWPDERDYFSYPEFSKEDLACKSLVEMSRLRDLVILGFVAPGWGIPNSQPHQSREAIEKQVDQWLGQLFDVLVKEKAMQVFFRHSYASARAFEGGITPETLRTLAQETEPALVCITKSYLNWIGEDQVCTLIAACMKKWYGVECFTGDVSITEKMVAAAFRGERSLSILQPEFWGYAASAQVAGAEVADVTANEKAWKRESKSSALAT